MYNLCIERGMLMKKFWDDFKKFITRGNVLDMAIGVIVGGAFNTIVTTLNNQVLMPVINWGLSYLSDGSELCTVLPNYVLFDPTIHEGATPIVVNGISYYTVNYINWSAMIEAIFNFFFIALTLFIILKVFTFVAKKRAELGEIIKSKINKNDDDSEALETE